MRLSREVEALIAYVDAAGIPYRVTSTTGGRHAETSRHFAAGTDGQGLAVDFAGPQPDDKPAMLDIYRLLLARHDQLHELIFWWPGKVGALVRRRVQVVPMTYGAAVLDAHRLHVHASVDVGTYLEAPPRKEPAMADNPELPNITGPVELHVLMNSEGQCTGYIIFSTRTGELHTFGPGAHYYGRSEVVV